MVEGETKSRHVKRGRSRNATAGGRGIPGMSVSLCRRATVVTLSYVPKLSNAAWRNASDLMRETFPHRLVCGGCKLPDYKSSTSK